MSTRTEIDNLIGENKVMVFSKSYCPYCTRAKEAIRAQGVSYHAIELDKIPNGDKIQEELLSKTGQRTVPNIFVGGTHVGGCDKTLEAIGNGNFQRLLNA
mmetsp:Transcript_1379/g.1464  ORF Transcript_1379/g.1464 Transcript_1379/m.1464 type:complete len:100 (+) Transcript_1379:225-524(+)|eukprot:CAMPEP_0173151340 /NCGR_PEP_ID=MMETSP1105-20130129/11512_1 /TAXON_ID=2985 /ORGANISM="Ochromonas sp., Strain BG-1" /LENGTH=99 /DNA_ID=CAMNT_0014066677 /DNA_START=214 /DNA_END=513 /DNA_ORIENTATION=+